MNSPGSSGSYFSWYTDFHALQKGEWPCTNTYNAYGYPNTSTTTEWCYNNTAYFVVKVFRKAGAAATCNLYQLTLKNE